MTAGLATLNLAWVSFHEASTSLVSCVSHKADRLRNLMVIKHKSKSTRTRPVKGLLDRLCQAPEVAVSLAEAFPNRPVLGRAAMTIQVPVFSSYLSECKKGSQVKWSLSLQAAQYCIGGEVQIIDFMFW